jgi:YbbR domain-containing protein
VDKRKDKQIGVKIVCVVASFVLWLYIANVENPRHEVKLRNVPVKLENVETLMQQKLSLLPDQPAPTVTLNLRGPASEVNRATAEQFEVVADLSAYRFSKGQWTVRVEIRKRPNNIDIVNDETQVISLKFDDFAEKSVPVLTDIAIEVKPGYMSFQPLPRPSTTYVSGPAQYVNSVSYVLAKATQKEPKDDNIEMSIPLNAYDEAGRKVSEGYVSIHPKVADVAVPIKKIKTVGINLRTKGNLNPDLIKRSTEILPDKIDIAGDAGTLNNITTIDTEIIDLATITSSITQEVKLILPNNVTAIGSNGIVSVKINVDKLITKNFTVDIKYENLRADYTVTMDKTKAVITVKGPENKINSLDTKDIKCYVDLANLGEIEDQTVPVIAANIEGLTIEGVNPKNIKVSIKPKPAIPTSTTPPASGTSGGNVNSGGTGSNGSTGSAQGNGGAGN